MAAAAAALADLSDEFRLPFSAEEALAALASREGLPLYTAATGNRRGTNRDPG